MYAALWRHLPGSRLVRALICLVLALVVLAICFTWVFPWVAPHMPFNDVTVGGSSP